MQHINYWKQFENTGKIEDYLNYRCYRKEPGFYVGDGRPQAQAGENPYAGIRMCDGNGAKTDADWGI